jgi:glycerol-3-phosphate O-acyltransferase / dihydroxyacetone phosphate acyltransferase
VGYSLTTLSEALAASNVKVAARDVVGTWKVLISLALAPITYAIYAFIAFILARKAGAGLKWQILTPIALICGLPFVGFAALKFGEAGMDVLK